MGQEIPAELRVRINTFLKELGISASYTTPALIMQAYQCIISEEIRYCVRELLEYKQREVHR